MTNELQVVNQNFAVPAYLQATVDTERAVNAAAGAGIAKSDFLPSLSIKGKCFSIRQNGDVKTFDMPALDVVVIAARPTISKVMYPGTYNPKDNSAPVCASIDSQVPDYESQAVDPATGKCPKNCAGCYFNQFGSATQGAGKACKDYKRLVVMLASPDGKNFPANAPALILDVPATSLKSPKGTTYMMLKECVNALDAGGVPLSAYVITLRFVMSSEFPQITFQPKRWVLPEEMERVKELRASEAVKNALEEKAVAPKKPEDQEAEETPAVNAVQAGPVPAHVAAEVKAPVVSQPETKNQEPAGLFASATPQGQADAVTETSGEVDVMAEAEALLNQYKI